LFDEGNSNRWGLDREGLGSSGDQRVKRKKKRAKKKKLILRKTQPCLLRYRKPSHIAKENGTPTLPFL
jgi:hypothetical protein